MRRPTVSLMMLAATTLLFAAGCPKEGGSDGCTDGDRKELRCNICTCHDGAWACTERACLDGFSDVDGPADAGDSGPGCRIGETRESGCNTCMCTRTGWACTSRACPPPDTSEPDPDTGGGADVAADVGDTEAAPEDVAPDAQCRLTGTVDVSGSVGVHASTAEFDSGTGIGGTSIWFQTAARLSSGATSRGAALRGRRCDPAAVDFAAGLKSLQTSYASTTVEVDTGRRLLGLVDDNPATGENDFVPTASILAEPTLTSPLAAEAAYAVSARTERRLSFLAAGIPGSGVNGRAGELVQKGFLMIRFVDGSGTGIEGVVVSRQNGSRVSEAIYPNSSFGNATGGNSGTTADHGVAFIPTAPAATYTGTKSGRTFETIQVGSTAGFATTVDIEAQ